LDPGRERRRLAGCYGTAASVDRGLRIKACAGGLPVSASDSCGSQVSKSRPGAPASVVVLAFPDPGHPPDAAESLACEVERSRVGVVAPGVPDRDLLQLPDVPVGITE